MSTGEQFRAELRKAPAELHKQQRTRHGKRPKNSVLYLGYRRKPPGRDDKSAVPPNAGADPD